MTNNKWWIYFALVLGALTVLSGLYFVFLGGYIQGIAGMAVGAFLIWMNVSKYKQIQEDQ